MRAKKAIPKKRTPTKKAKARHTMTTPTGTALPHETVKADHTKVDHAKTTDADKAMADPAAEEELLAGMSIAERRTYLEAKADEREKENDEQFEDAAESNRQHALPEEERDPKYRATPKPQPKREAVKP